MMKYFFMLSLIYKFSVYFKFLMLLNLFLVMNLFDFNYMNLSSFYMFDEMSYFLTMLVVWVFSLIFLIFNGANKLYFYFLIKSLNLLLVLIFILVDFFYFYLFFEVSLIFMFMMIISFGKQFERLSAGMYMIFYTIFPSLLMLLGIYKYYDFYSDLVLFFWVNQSKSLFISLSFMLMFLIKMPIFLFHYWLPKVHVEASLEGSIILASIFLKLGSYGVYRVLAVLESLLNFYKIYFMFFFLVSSVLVSGLCCLQVDLKMLIAYSSIVHMSFMMVALMSFLKFGYFSILIIMISHGLCSSGLFFLVNLIYQRLLSRSIIMIKGLISIMPGLTMFMFLMSSSNFSCPPSLNFMGEFHIILSGLKITNVFMVFIMMYVFFSALYSLMMYVCTQFGKMDVYMKLDIYNLEFLIIMLFWLPLNLISLIKILY
uniref:NADH-ubiquinone oxidoreductase chain 4 n=1 Tax=Xenos vesparum TaxID=31928 RepID=B7ZE94_9NEOP|nr:NADH dehydrogenase subunit 4 [Xenos vesparum]